MTLRHHRVPRRGTTLRPTLIVLLLVTGCGAPSARSGPSAGTQGAPRGEEAAVLAVAQALFDAMAERDTSKAAAVLLPEGFFHALVDGTATTTSHQEFLRRMAASTERWLERLWDPQVEVHGGLATVWAPYDFWRDGVFSHCGVDAFTLVKTGGEWKIAGIAYTVERTGCPPSPLGPPDGAHGR